MSSKNIQTELEEIRNKVRLLKESNKFFENESSKNIQNLLKWERNLINRNICIDSNITKNKKKWETRKLINEEEALIVANCYRKSMELVKKKEKNKRINYVFNVIHSCSENNSANYDAEGSNTLTFANECDRNISSKSKKFNCNPPSNERAIVNCNLQSNSKGKINKTVKNKKDMNSSSAILKHTMDRGLQNDTEMPIKESNINIETLTDVVFLKTVTHSRVQTRKKKKRKSLTKETDKNELSNETFNVSEEIKKHSKNNVNQELLEHGKKHPENNQKNTEVLDIVYLNTPDILPSIITLDDINENCKQVNNSERINSTNFVQNNVLQSISDQNNPTSLFHNCDSLSSFQTNKKVFVSQNNANWLSSAELKTSNILIDLSSEEEEPETIVTKWDFTEEPVDFSVPVLHINENCSAVSKSKIQLLRTKGIVIKQGKWSEKDIALLKRNYKEFVHRFGISDARLLLGIGSRNSNKYENVNIRKFLRAKHFFVRLGKDLNHRLLHGIYEKARSMFHPFRYKRNNGQKSFMFLLRLQQKYGNNWELIAKKFGRSSKYCMNLYRENKKCYSKGKWLDTEIEKLTCAVEKVSKSSNILPQNLKNLSWKKVSELVGTRSPTQCWTRWYKQ